MKGFISNVIIKIDSYLSDFGVHGHVLNENGCLSPPRVGTLAERSEGK